MATPHYPTDQLLPMASFEANERLTESMVPRKKCKTTNPRTVPRTGTPQFTFQLNTPDSIRQQLHHHAQRRLASIPQHEAHLPADDTNPRKRKANDTSSLPATDLSEGANPTLDVPLELATKVNPGKRNVGGRPRLHPKKETQLTGLPILRTNKPVMKEINPDIWCRIFDFCRPEFLLQARQATRLFNFFLLNKESQWRNARVQNFGENHPNPPPGLCERQYADLITGVGCQTKACKDKGARKVFWAFQRRWCGRCLKDNTLKEEDATFLAEKYPGLLECISKATFDSWGRYCYMEKDFRKPDWAKHTGNHARFSRWALKRCIEEFDDYLAVGPNKEQKTEAEVDAWVEQKKASNAVVEAALLDIEDYESKAKDQKSIASKKTKADRVAFFRERALALTPPLSEEALNMLPKYLASIEIPKPPTERAWRELLPKLLKDRAKAEMILSDEAKVDGNAAFCNQLVRSYEATQEKRRGNATPEQKSILRLADEVIAALSGAIEAREVAHIDFVPLAFRKVFEAYNLRYDTSKPDYGGTRYYLLLADAKMVYTEKLLPFILRWGDVAKTIQAKELKCPGCKRRDCHRLFSFEKLMDHIATDHTKDIGSLSYFRVPVKTLPSFTMTAYCRLRWPRNLPILASHQQVISEWDPEDDSEYVHAPVELPRNLSHNAFEGRCVQQFGGPPPGDLLKDIVYAGSLLVGAPIGDKFKTLIAFKFALDRHSKSGEEPDVPVEVLRELPTALIQAGIRGLFEDFHCQTCSNDEARERRHKRYVEKNQSLGDLVKHYVACHDHSLWTTRMFDLPSAEELWETLTNPGMEKALQVFTELFP